MNQRPPPLPGKPGKRRLVIVVAVVLAIGFMAVGVWQMGSMLSKPAVQLVAMGKTGNLIAEGDRRRNRGDFAGAESKYREALKLTPEDVIAFRLIVQWKLVETLEALGKRKEEITLLREMLSDSTAHNGPDSKDTVSCVRWLGYALKKEGDFEEAEVLHRRALAASEKLGNNKAEELSDDLMRLADLLQRTDRPSEGIPLARRSVEILEMIPNRKSETYSTALITLGCLLRDNGEREEAETVLRRALAVQEANSKVKQLDLAYTRLTLGILCRREGKRDEAMTLLQSALPVLERELGFRHRDVLAGKSNLEKLTRVKAAGEDVSD